MSFDDNERLEQILGGSEGVKGIPRRKNQGQETGSRMDKKFDKGRGTNG